MSKRRSLDDLDSSKRMKEIEDFQLGKTILGDMCRNHKWVNTAVGPISTWPQSLRTASSICLNNIFPCLVVWGKEMTMIYNSGYAQILQQRHPNALGAKYFEVWSDIWNDIGGLVDDVMINGNSHYLEDSVLWMLNSEGVPQERYFTYSFSPIYVEGGTIGGLLNIATETTERIQNSRQLNLLREMGSHISEATKMESAISIVEKVLENNINDIPFSCIYLAEQNRLKLTCNVRIEKLTEVSPDIIQEGFLYGSKNQENFAKAVQSVVTTGVSQYFDFTGFSIPEISRIHLSNAVVRGCMLMPFELRQNNSLGVIVVAVSPNRSLDQNYQGFFILLSGQTAAVLGNASAHEEERKKAEALVELDRVKTQFFSNISHEFRTPITLMLGPIEDLISQTTSTEANETLDQLELIHRNALRLLKLVNTLLDFSRIEAGRMEATFRQVDISSLTENLASVFRSACERAGLDYIVDCEKIEGPVFVDVDMYEKIVLNLISNSYKFTMKGHIAIRIKKIGALSLQLSVEDTGTGIPEEEVPRIFERFHRVAEAKGRTHEGTGIGLAMVSELVKLHGGTIQAYSKYGKGSLFIVTLNVGYSHLPSERVKFVKSPEERRKPSYVRTEEWWLGSETDKPLPVTITSTSDSSNALPYILVVDDNADMREYIFKLLKNQYNVEVACDGLAALESVSKRIPQCILSDVMMPKLDGFGLVEKLREDPKTRMIPVILLSARAGEEARVEGLKSGADDYLTKPFTARELQARIKTHISLNQMRTEAAEMSDQANKAKDHFLAVLSHELRTPLTPALMLAESLESNSSLPTEVTRDLELITKNIKLEVRLIDDLLDVTKITKNKLILALKSVNVHKELEHTLHLIKHDIQEKGIQLESSFDATSFVMKADSSRLQQIFWNIVKNAIKFTPEGGKIKISTRNEENGQITVRVTDSGIGISPEALPKVFDSFQQGGVSITQQFGGLGLGLSISKALTNMMNGTINAESEGFGEGATFYVTFPVISSDADKSPPRESYLTNLDVPAQKILLVEDNKSTALVMMRFLKKFGHDVKIAYCSKEAAELAQVCTFDLVISDVGLPDGSGFDLMKKLHNLYGLRGICVSGYGMEEDVKKSKECGFDMHIVKPVETQVLKSAIAYVVNVKLLNNKIP